MPQYPPNDQSQARAEAAAGLLAAIREVRDANERLQIAAAWVLEAFGDKTDAETIRMLPVGGPARPGRPPVPGTMTRQTAEAIADLLEADMWARGVPLRAVDDPSFVTGDESGSIE